MVFMRIIWWHGAIDNRVDALKIIHDRFQAERVLHFMWASTSPTPNKNSKEKETQRQKCVDIDIWRWRLPRLGNH